MSNRMTLLLQRLLGMYFFYEGGGFYAAWRMLRWLIANTGKQDQSWMCDQAEELESALAYHCFGVQPHHYDSVLLEVVYKGSESNDFNGTVRDRRCSSDNVWFPGHAQEHDNWASLWFSPTAGTFLSKNMLCQQGGDGAGTSGFSYVPGKVANWLFGKPLCRQLVIKGKKSDASSADILLLQETEDGQLWVKNRNYGWLCTARGRGSDIGHEKRFDSIDKQVVAKSNPIFSSHEQKCLMSSLTTLRVPQKVTDWLRWQSLSMLVSPALKTGESNSQKRVEKVSDDTLQWSYQGRAFTCTCVPAVGSTEGGCLVRETQADSPNERQPLIYTLECQAWLSPSILSAEEAQLPE